MMTLRSSIDRGSRRGHGPDAAYRPRPPLLSEAAWRRTCGFSGEAVPESPEFDTAMRYPSTLDGRYFVVKGRLWRCSNPELSAEERERLTRELMKARSAVGIAKRAGDVQAEHVARRRVHEIKVALGERGPVWWSDGAPDYNRRMVKNTPYWDWFRSIRA